MQRYEKKVRCERGDPGLQWDKNRKEDTQAALECAGEGDSLRGPGDASLLTQLGNERDTDCGSGETVEFRHVRPHEVRHTEHASQLSEP